MEMTDTFEFEEYQKLVENLKDVVAMLDELESTAHIDSSLVLESIKSDILTKIDAVMMVCEHLETKFDGKK